MIKLKPNKVYFVGEIGINHDGSIKKIKNYIDIASKYGIDAIKLQLGTPFRFTTIENKKRFDLRTKTMIQNSDLDKLAMYAKKKNVLLFASPLSEDYVKLVADKFGVIKIASGDINFLPILKEAYKSKKLTIISTGASTIKEILDIFKIFKNKKKVILMHCISNYPTEIENSNLINVKYLRKKFGVHVGYSNHVLGTTACEVAIIMGARIVEFHLTDNKHRKFIDHKISLEPKDFVKLKIKANEIIKSIGKKRKRQFFSEKSYKELRKGLIYSTDLKKGTILKKSHLSYARPAKYLSYNSSKLVIGKKLKKDVRKFNLTRIKDFF
tara:strand:+ start:393 stop:1367 length:975 start_codon:yes stop_codon:yes gene_type:complete